MQFDKQQGQQGAGVFICQCETWARVNRYAQLDINGQGQGVWQATEGWLNMGPADQHQAGVINLGQGWTKKGPGPDQWRARAGRHKAGKGPGPDQQRARVA